MVGTNLGAALLGALWVLSHGLGPGVNMGVVGRVMDP